MKKNFTAFLAALLITATLGVSMFAIGQDSLGISTAQAATETTTPLSSESLSQLEQVLVQYQTREIQYQTELETAIERLNTANQQLTQANQQIQKYQNLLAQLQNNGLITIASDGTVSLNQPSFAQQGDRPGRNH